MSKAPSILRDLQEAITGRLQGCAALDGIQIYDRRTGEIENAVKLQLASLGITIFVSPVAPKGFSEAYPAPVFSSGDFTVRILENPTTNRTGRDAYHLMEMVIRRLHLWQPGVSGAGAVTVDPDPLDDNSSKDRVIFDLLFHVSATMEAGAD